MLRSAILLDLDGTLVDSLADIAASANHVRAAFDLPPLPAAAVRRMIGDGARKLLERSLADAAAPPSIETALGVYEAHHAEQCTAAVRTYPGVAEQLERWRGENRALAVVTNKPERFARRIVEHLHLDRFVGVIVGGDTTPERKPSPVPLRAALAMLGRPAGVLWAVGDGLQDLRAGRAAGLRTVAALYGFGDPDALRAEGADVYWDRFGATELASDPSHPHP
ncbi:MAG: HAD-IA family hydrolase [Planctomycetes bacterium]|nr:HAD-IA family hydrolase [Planctomycetota bacterium]